MDGFVTWFVISAITIALLSLFFIDDYSRFRDDTSIEVHRYTSVDAGFKALEKNRYGRR